MAKIGAAVVALIAASVAGAAIAQTATSITPPTAPTAGPGPATKPMPVIQPKLDASAEAARRAVDDRLKRRDAAARRAMQGICKGC